MHGTLRHAGLLVRDLETEIKRWQSYGFEPLEVEALRVCKMTDKNGATIELVEGNWHPHIAVNWYEDDNGNYIEAVEEVKTPLQVPWGYWESGIWHPNPNIEMSEQEQRKRNQESGYDC